MPLSTFTLTDQSLREFGGDTVNLHFLRLQNASDFLAGAVAVSVPVASIKGHKPLENAVNTILLSTQNRYEHTLDKAGLMMNASRWAEEEAARHLKSFWGKTFMNKQWRAESAALLERIQGHAATAQAELQQAESWESIAKLGGAAVECQLRGEGTVRLLMPAGLLKSINPQTIAPGTPVLQEVDRGSLLALTNA